MPNKLLILLIALTMVAFSVKASPVLNNIINPPNGKHSSIIRIESQSTLSTCTAFVLNDKVAVTAAHCLPNKPLVSNPLLPLPPVPLKIENVFQVYNSKGVNTYIIVKAAKPRVDTDLVFLTGDFTSFNKIGIDVSSFNYKPGENLYACGFAGGFFPPTCNTGELLGTSTFMGVMNNYLAQGMSGGPVLNSKFQVIGVNSSRSEDGQSFFSILFGHVRMQK